MADERHPLEEFCADSPFYSGESSGFKRGRNAKNEIGVGWFAPWEQPFAGFPEHSRRCARALADAGCVLHLRSVDAASQIRAFTKEMNELQERFDDLLGTEVARYAAFVHMLVPNSTSLQAIVSNPNLEPDERDAVNARRVIYTVWERQSVPLHVIQPLETVGQVWVACHDNAHMLNRCGLPREKLRVVPVPYFPDDPHLDLEGRTRDMKRPVCFYSIGKWEPRKDQHRAMLSFLRAFRPFQCAFVVKTSAYGPNAPGYPKTPEESLALNLRDPDVIRNGWTHENVTKGGLMVVTGVLPDDAIVNLHRLGDVYVSLSHGEGFDMPAFDAKLSGNLMVYTPSGGPQDFRGGWDVQVNPSERTVPCNIWYQWAGSSWLDHDVDVAAHAMQLARERVLDGKRSRDMDPTPFSAEVVGRKMLGYLEELTGESLRKKE
jgi:hypothetical protein